MTFVTGLADGLSKGIKGSGKNLAQTIERKRLEQEFRRKQNTPGSDEYTNRNIEELASQMSSLQPEIVKTDLKVNFSEARRMKNPNKKFEFLGKTLNKYDIVKKYAQSLFGYDPGSLRGLHAEDLDGIEVKKDLITELRN